MTPRLVAFALLVAVPLVWRAGLWLAYRATRDASLARVLAPGCAGASLLLLTHVLGLVFHSSHVGLLSATALCALAGVLSLRARLPVDLSRRTGWMLAGAVLIVLPMLGPELKWAAHDEDLVMGHVSNALQIQNGVYPPRHLAFPQFELRYHYAIDLAGAAFSTLLGRLDMLESVHLLAMVLWVYAFCLFWTVGERLIGGPRAGPVTAFTVLLAGGAPLLADRSSLGAFLTGVYDPGGAWITPPVISNFLQHPWSLGIPLLAMILLLSSSIRAQLSNRWWWLLLSILFALLSVSQAVLFVCLLPTVVLFGSLDGWRPALPRLGRFLPWGVSIVGVASLLHGFFAHTAEPPGTMLKLRAFLSDTAFGEWVNWHLSSLGFLLPLGLLGLRFFGPQRWMLAVLAGGSLLARDVLVYPHTTDIVKFSMVTQLSLAMLSASVIVAALRRPWTRWLGVVAFVGCVAFGVGWSLALTLDLPGVIFARALPPPPAPADEAAIAFLRPHVREGEGVLRTERPEVYALYGGIPQTGTDWAVTAFGFSPALVEARSHLLNSPSAPRVDYLAQGVRWVVIAPGDAEREKSVMDWCSHGDAYLAAAFPPLKLYRIK